MGGYFLFVLGERANSGTLWSSAGTRKGGGKREKWGERDRKRQTGGDEEVGNMKWVSQLGSHKFNIKSDLQMPRRGRCESTPASQL